MAKYVDGFVIPLKKKNVKAYLKLAKLGCRVWMDHGALDYYECVGDDLNTLCGLTFPRMCKLKSDETIVFAYIVYRSKAHRDQVNTRVMKDKRMQFDPKMKMPFDMKKFSVGGFKVLVNAK